MQSSWIWRRAYSDDSDGMLLLRGVPGVLAQVARGLGISTGAVAKWRRVPADRVLAVERLTGLSRHDLRPDLYPRPYSESTDQKLAKQSGGKQLASRS